MSHIKHKIHKHARSFMDFFMGAFQLIFPHNCLACGNHLRYSEHTLCTACLLDIPLVHSTEIENNAFENLFLGQIPYERCTTFFYYSKKNKYSTLIHSLKYNGNKKTGIFLGEIFAQQLQELNFMSDIDYIVPVPLHSKRQRSRGYNQSEVLAQGIANVCDTPLCINAVKRIVNTETQTKKNKEERKQNVANIFTVEKPSLLEGKHILLLDDVITTGATTISCAETIFKQVENVRISIASVGFSGN